MTYRRHANGHEFYTRTCTLSFCFTKVFGNICHRKIPCADCNAVYIGETKRSLNQRAKEHARAVKNGDVDKNEIADHCWKNDHKFNWENKAII